MWQKLTNFRPWSALLEASQPAWNVVIPTICSKTVQNEAKIIPKVLQGQKPSEKYFEENAAPLLQELSQILYEDPSEQKTRKQCADLNTSATSVGTVVKKFFKESSSTKNNQSVSEGKIVSPQKNAQAFKSAPFLGQVNYKVLQVRRKCVHLCPRQKILLKKPSVLPQNPFRKNYGLRLKNLRMKEKILNPVLSKYRKQRNSKWTIFTLWLLPMTVSLTHSGNCINCLPITKMKTSETTQQRIFCVSMMKISKKIIWVLSKKAWVRKESNSSPMEDQILSWLKLFEKWRKIT